MYRQLQRSLWAPLAYPLILIGLTTLVFLVLGGFVVSQFAMMYEEYELMLPPATKTLIDASKLSWPILKAFPLVAAGIVVLRFGLARAQWARLVEAIPLVGPPWKWSGVAQWARLLGLLIECDIPLPAELRITHHRYSGGIAAASGPGCQRSGPESTVRSPADPTDNRHA